MQKNLTWSLLSKSFHDVVSSTVLVIEKWCNGASGRKHQQKCDWVHPVIWVLDLLINKAVNQHLVHQAPLFLNQMHLYVAMLCCTTDWSFPISIHSSVKGVQTVCCLLSPPLCNAQRPMNLQSHRWPSTSSTNCGYPWRCFGEVAVGQLLGVPVWMVK